jgi:peptide/nickel transport system substrate-binding protein
VLLVACLAALVAVSACTSSSSSKPSADRGSAKGGTLTVVSVVAPQTLDPAKTPQNNAWFEQLAYEPLIVRKSDGSFAPGLASSWQYEGSDNTKFVLNLRPGVTFSDGGKLTAQNVVDHLAYVQKSPGQMAPFLADDTFVATGPMTVTITAKAPNPNFREILTQDYIIGGVISPAGLKATDSLGTKTLGAGPYQLDPNQTVAGSRYTYVPNPNYYDQSAVHWSKVVIRVITSPQAALNAVRSGAADVSVGDPSTLDAARKAGLTVAAAPLLWSGVVLADRDGKMAVQLKDPKVRQALNFATDRQSITNALFKGIGEPTVQITVPNGPGFDPALNSTYPYDTNKAKQLLAQAGYPNGFALRLTTPQYQQLNLIAQALQQQWKQVGVDLQITDQPNPTKFASDTFGGKYPAFMIAFGQLPIWMQGPSLYLPKAAYNPFHNSDSTLQSLYDQSSKANGGNKAALDQKVIAQLTNGAWFVPVVSTSLPYYAGKKVGNVQTSAGEPLLSLAEITPAG